MEISVTNDEIARVRQEIISLKIPDVDYIVSFYRAVAEIAKLRRHIADIGEAMRTKAMNNPDGVKASTLELLGEELLSALPPNAALTGAATGSN